VPQRTVWLRRDPVGSKTLLPTRDEFRARFARRAFLAGVVAVVALAGVVLLRALDRMSGLWPLLHVLALVFAIAGVAAAAVALRGAGGRRDALVGLGLSTLAFVGALFLPQLVS
jgi:hypothetical protein